MFYSHEILTSGQYGVSTIWLVATVGKNNQRRLNKKAIQEVNVPRACEKILDPGPPLALRLQGNLLYGVSRVFSQQCGYVLSDAEKTQSDMMTFFRVMQTSEVDPRAGQTKRTAITLQDDPNFDPMTRLPSLDSLTNDMDWKIPSQGSASKFSQMTPLDHFIRRDSSLSVRQSSLYGIDLPPSSHSPGSYRLPSDLYGRSSPFPNPTLQSAEGQAQFVPFAEEEMDPMSTINLDFDANGNLIGIVEPEQEPLQLPRLNDSEQRLPLQDNNNAVLFDEPHLPDALPFSSNVVDKNKPISTEAWEPHDDGGTKEMKCPTKRKRTARGCPLIDEKIQFSGKEYKNWSHTYTKTMLAASTGHFATPMAQAKKNGTVLMFGNGLGHVGAIERALGFQTVLAEEFAGNNFRALIYGREPDDENKEEEPARGRRRKSDEVFEQQHEDERNVRQKVESEVGRGNNFKQDDHLALGEDSLPEVGMYAPVMDEHSSSLMPWSRQGSVVPGSSIRAPGSAYRSTITPSPLHQKSSVIGSLERHSDASEGAFAPIDFHSLDDAAALLGGSPLNLVTEGLDVASQDFLDYIARRTLADHYGRASHGRRWIDFEQLANPAAHNRAVAAQAFLHVLSLATKNVVKVEQEGRAEGLAFGTIHIALDMALEPLV